MESKAPPAPRVPDRPRPKLAVTTRQPIGAVLDFLNDCLEIVAGQRTEMADALSSLLHGARRSRGTRWS